MNPSPHKPYSSQTPVILWFRQDLRISNNFALEAALKTGQPIIPLFIFDEEDLTTKRFWSNISYSPGKTGNNGFGIRL